MNYFKLFRFIFSICFFFSIKAGLTDIQLAGIKVLLEDEYPQEHTDKIKEKIKKQIELADKWCENLDKVPVTKEGQDELAKKYGLIRICDGNECNNSVFFIYLRKNIYIPEESEKLNEKILIIKKEDIEKVKIVSKDFLIKIFYRDYSYLLAHYIDFIKFDDIESSDFSPFEFEILPDRKNSKGKYQYINLGNILDNFSFKYIRLLIYKNEIELLSKKKLTSYLLTLDINNKDWAHFFKDIEKYYIHYPFIKEEEVIQKKINEVIEKTTHSDTRKYIDEYKKKTQEERRKIEEKRKEEVDRKNVYEEEMKKLKKEALKQPEEKKKKNEITAEKRLELRRAIEDQDRRYFTIINRINRINRDVKDTDSVQIIIDLEKELEDVRVAIEKDEVSKKEELLKSYDELSSLIKRKKENIASKEKKQLEEEDLRKKKEQEEIRIKKEQDKRFADAKVAADKKSAEAEKNKTIEVEEKKRKDLEDQKKRDDALVGFSAAPPTVNSNIQPTPLPSVSSSAVSPLNQPTSVNSDLSTSLNKVVPIQSDYVTSSVGSSGSGGGRKGKKGSGKKKKGSKKKGKKKRNK